MSPSTQVQSVIAVPLCTSLLAHGFDGRALAFRREVGGTTQVVQVQAKRGTSGSAEFVLNLGVLLPEVDRMLRRPRVSKPMDTQCTVRTRVGPRAGSKSWWTVKRGDTTAPSSLIRRVEKGVIPWFTMASDLAALSRALEAGKDVWSDDRLFGMGVAMALGDRALARARLQQEVAEIQAARAARAAQFPRDPFGTDVLRRAAKLGEEHGLL